MSSLQRCFLYLHLEITSNLVAVCPSLWFIVLTELIMGTIWVTHSCVCFFVYCSFYTCRMPVGILLVFSLLYPLYLETQWSLNNCFLNKWEKPKKMGSSQNFRGQEIQEKGKGVWCWRLINTTVNRWSLKAWPTCFSWRGRTCTHPKPFFRINLHALSTDFHGLNYFHHLDFEIIL